MNSKKIIISIISIILLALVIFFFVGKNKVDSVLSEEIKNELQNVIDSNELPIKFEDISVSSLGADLTLKNFEIHEDGTSVYFDEIIIGTSYKEILNIIKTQDFDKINSFDLGFKNIVINSPADNFFKHKIASNITIDYDGSLTKEMFFY